MAQNAATKTSEFGGFIKPELAQAYFDEARKYSVVQQLARKVTLGAAGIEIPIVTSKPTASWVSEAGQKPTTSGGLGLKTMKPHKIAAISVVSAEVVRANPGGYMEILKADIAEAFAKAFDEAALYGTNSPFGENQHLAATTKSVELGTATAETGGIFADVNSGLSLLVKDKKKLTGFAFDSLTEPLFNASVDKNGRPLFVDSPTVDTAASVTAGRLLSRPAFIADNIAKETTVGFAGDYSKALWGVVGGITYDISTETAVTLNGQLTSLWEHNLVAIRAEAEFGWYLHDKDAFVKFTEAG